MFTSTIPVVDLALLEQRLRHECVVRDHVDPTEALDGGIDEPLDLRAFGAVGLERECAAALALQLVDERIHRAASTGVGSRVPDGWPGKSGAQISQFESTIPLVVRSG